MKPVGPDATASLRSDHNTIRLMSFHFEEGVSRVSGYDDSRSRECTPYVSRPPELELHLQFDREPKDATQGFVFGTDKKRCDVQLLENPDPDPDNRYGISRQHFRIDFNWKSGFLRLNNMSPTNGTGMSAPSVNNGNQMLRYNNMHMLHPLDQTKVRAGTLVFEISFPGSLGIFSSPASHQTSFIEGFSLISKVSHPNLSFFCQPSFHDETASPTIVSVVGIVMSGRSKNE